MAKTWSEWWAAHKPTKRRLIQVYAALLYNAYIKGFITGDIYVGPTKNICVPGFNCYSCPGAIGACPLGALQNAKQKGLSLTDDCSAVEALGMTVLLTDGSEENIKFTTPLDLDIAGLILKRRQTP